MLENLDRNSLARVNHSSSFNNPILYYFKVVSYGVWALIFFCRSFLHFFFWFFSLGGLCAFSIRSFDVVGPQLLVINVAYIECGKWFIIYSSVLHCHRPMKHHHHHHHLSPIEWMEPNLHTPPSNGISMMANETMRLVCTLSRWHMMPIAKCTIRLEDIRLYDYGTMMMRWRSI